MLIDLSYKVTKKDYQNAFQNEKNASFGHIGTHFDAMGKEFPLHFVRRTGIVFDVRNKMEIGISDVSFSLVEKDQFVLFNTGFIESKGYATDEYIHHHPELSDSLIEALIEKGVSIIGIDCAGIKNAEAHSYYDRLCADHGTFVVENLCNLQTLYQLALGNPMIVHTYPINFGGISGLLCRVVAEIFDGGKTNGQI